QEFVADMRGGDAGDLRVVVARRDLDDVRADEVEPGERPHHAEQFAAGQPAGLWRASPWRVRWVEHVDVYRYIHRPVTDAVGDSVDHAGDPKAVGRGRRHRLESESGVIAEVGYSAKRAVNADLNTALRD